MKKPLLSSICAVAVMAVLIGFSGQALAQSAQVLPIPEAPVATNIPGRARNARPEFDI